MSWNQLIIAQEIVWFLVNEEKCPLHPQCQEIKTGELASKNINDGMDIRPQVFLLLHQFFFFFFSAVFNIRAIGLKEYLR